MKIQLQRYAQRQGKRKDENASFVEWDIKVDKNKIIIQTETNVYTVLVKGE